MFIPCPNAKAEAGFNQGFFYIKIEIYDLITYLDKFIPNPSITSPTKLLQFEFIGKLIGIAIRTKSVLDLNFPSIIWKPLVCSHLDRSDLEAIDKYCCQFLDSIRNIAKEGVTEETFNEYIFETFSTQTSDGRLVELKPG